MYLSPPYAGTNCPYFVQRDGKEWGVFTFLGEENGPARRVSIHKRRDDACDNALSLTKLKDGLDGLSGNGDVNCGL